MSTKQKFRHCKILEVCTLELQLWCSKTANEKIIKVKAKKITEIEIQFGPLSDLGHAQSKIKFRNLNEIQIAFYFNL